MEILPVNDLDVALHEFVNKDDKMAFYSCLQYNLEETRNKISSEDSLKFKEEDLIVKVEECMQERVKGRSLHAKDGTESTPFLQSKQDTRGKSTQGPQRSNSFSDDEDINQMLSSSKSASRGRSFVTSRSSNDASQLGTTKASTRGRGRGRGRGGGRATGGLKQTTLDSSFSMRRSERSASVSASAAVRSIADDAENLDSPSSDDVEEFDANDVIDSSENEETRQGKGRKRAAPRGAASSSKRGKKSINSSVNKMLMKDDDDDDEDDMATRLKKVQPRATRKYGAVRR